MIELLFMDEGEGSQDPLCYDETMFTYLLMQRFIPQMLRIQASRRKHSKKVHMRCAIYHAIIIPYFIKNGYI